MEFPSNVKYTKEHEWIRVEGDIAYVGITDYAQEQLGDIVFVDITTEGETLEKDEVFGTIEVVKTICAALNKVKAENYESLITYVTDRAGHDRRYAMDDSKALKELGYTRKYDFDSGMQQTIEWYLQNTDWAAAVTGKKKAA